MRVTVGAGELYIIEVERIRKDTGVRTYVYFGPYEKKSTAKGIATQERNREARYGNADVITNITVKSTTLDLKTVTD